jgi:MoxR-like ATPase
MTTEFRGTERYIATPELMAAVNAAIVLSRPLLIKGEPGTGKTLLANEIARALDKPFFEWHIKSTTKALQGLYEYDAVSRLRDSQLGDPRVKDIHNYILKGNLWEAFDCDVQPVLLIDEIDKADIEFPNDLLRELDRMEFYVYETRETVRAKHRPIIVITSNNEKELPDAANHRRAFSGSEARPAARSADHVFQDTRNARLEEETDHLRIAGLDQAAGDRGYTAGSSAQR